MTSAIHKRALASHRAHAWRLRRARQRGFTLIEMLIAMVSGLLVAAAAFLLARNASSFFQSEAGITTAQFSTMLGFARLQEDLRRAGLMSTANVASDPLRCGTTAGWPASMAELASIRIESGGSVVRHGSDHTLSQLTDNGLNPDALIIGGMYGGTEHYAIQAMIADGGGGYLIELQNDGAMLRTQAASGSGATPLTDLFRIGRMLRLIDPEGRAAYGRIIALDTSGANVTIHVGNVPAMPVKETQVTCGCALPCIGGLVNPLSRFLYDLRSVPTTPYTQYAGLYTNASHTLTAAHKGTTPAARTELIRVELDVDGTEITDTLEILSEYTVDLKFGITTATPAVAPANLPTITRYPIGHPSVYTTAAAIGSGGTPQRIQAVQVRMSVRASERDRDVAIANPPDGGIFRFSLGLDGSGNPRGFARVRTLVADVSLPNVSGANW